MSIRWMAVQYVGDTLRIPVANESDMDKPFGSSTLERDVRRIVVNPFSNSPQAFVPEAENAKLREELARARDPQRIGGQADPSSFVYAIEQLREFRWQHATNDEDAIPYINNVAAAHERENAKLWIFAKLMHGHIKECCDACGERGICDVDALARELGIEVE